MSEVNSITVLSHVTHLNGWDPGVYVSHMIQNFRLFAYQIHLI